jgi:hypothetical protein
MPTMETLKKVETDSPGETMAQTNPIREIIDVPIYGAKVFISVGNSVKQEVAKLEIFDPIPAGLTYEAVCCYSDNKHFALVFDYRKITYGVVAHEVFHLTHRIQMCVGSKFEEDNSEPWALLHEYLVDKVFAIIFNEKR